MVDPLKVKNNQLIIARSICTVAMNSMLETLEEFRGQSSELRILKDFKNQEQIFHNRFIKNEILDLAEQINSIKQS